MKHESKCVSMVKARVAQIDRDLRDVKQKIQNLTDLDQDYEYAINAYEMQIIELTATKVNINFIIEKMTETVEKLTKPDKIHPDFNTNRLIKPGIDREFAQEWTSKRDEMLSSLDKQLEEGPNLTLGEVIVDSIKKGDHSDLVEIFLEIIFKRFYTQSYVDIPKDKREKLEKYVDRSNLKENAQLSILDVNKNEESLNEFKQLLEKQHLRSPSGKEIFKCVEKLQNEIEEFEKKFLADFDHWVEVDQDLNYVQGIFDKKQTLDFDPAKEIYHQNQDVVGDTLN